VSNEAVSTRNTNNDGKLMGLLSIAVAPGALLVSPTMFPLVAFFLAMLGLTVAAPKNRYLSIIGIIAAGTCGVIGYYFHTPIV
jgi:hypothetical protein